MVTEEARYLSALRERLSIKLISGIAVGERKKACSVFWEISALLESKICRHNRVTTDSIPPSVEMKTASVVILRSGSTFVAHGDTLPDRQDLGVAQ